MAAPARKRVLKKVSTKKSSESEVVSKPAKAAAKVDKPVKASKKKAVAQTPVTESAPAPAKSKKGVIPVPIFQAPARTKDSTKKSSATATEKPVKTAPSTQAPKAEVLPVVRAMMEMRADLAIAIVVVAEEVEGAIAATMLWKEATARQLI